MISDAIFSPCRQYRYVLHRGDGRGPLWVMLNPSIADSSADDPTIRKVRGFTSRLGHDSFTVGNLAALVSTDPKAMLAALRRGEDVAGPDNLGHIQHCLERTAHVTHVIYAWGTNGKKLQPHIAAVAKLVKASGLPQLTLGPCKNGEPRHPLMVGYDDGMRFLGMEGRAA